ncbi:MAG TPA: serine/threonine-protein kinase [Isosphaeraceae bacterium]|jgi:serine/threonine protein kinase
MPEKLQVGDWIGNRFEIFDIHVGGMGIVYVVYDHQGESGHRVLALKTLRDEFLLDSRQVSRFISECHTWIKLERHPFIVQAYAIQDFDGKPYAVLELVTGGDLRRWIGTSRLDVPQALRFGIQFCLGMEHAINKGLHCHRDIKPENLLITEGGTLKITDFGLAKVRDEEVGIRPDDPIPLVDGPGNEAVYVLEDQAWARPDATPEPADEPGPDPGAGWDGDVHVTQTYLSPLGTPPGPEPPDPGGDGETNFLATVDWERTSSSPAPGVDGLDSAANGTVGWPLQPPPGEPPAWDGTQAGAMLGTAVYMPPEQFRNAKGVNFRADIYAFGAVLFEMLTTHPPFRGDSVAKLEREHTKASPPSVVPYIPTRFARYAKEIDKIVQRCLTKEPSKRFATFAELRLSLTTALWHAAREKVSVPAASELEAWELTGKGVSLGTLGLYDEERSAYEESIQAKPEHVPAWFNQAAALGSLDRPEEAIDYADMALYLNPRSVPALINKGLALYALHKPEEALVCFDSAAHIQPRDPDVWYGRVVVLLGQQNLKAAKLALEQAQRLRPSYHEVFHAIAAALAGKAPLPDHLLNFGKAPAKHAAGANGGEPARRSSVPWVRRLEDTAAEAPKK